MADYHKARVPAWLAASAKSALVWRQGKKSARAASPGVSRGARGWVAARAAPPAAGGLVGARLLLGGLLPEPRLMWIRPTQSCSPRAGGEQESSRHQGALAANPARSAGGTITVPAALQPGAVPPAPKPLQEQRRPLFLF